MDLGLHGYKDVQATQLNQQILERVSTLPGVTSATLAANVPFLSGGSWDLSIDGYTSAGGEKFVDTNTNQIGPKYFATMQIPLLSGREFTVHDSEKAPQVADRRMRLWRAGTSSKTIASTRLLATSFDYATTCRSRSSVW